MRCLCGKTLTSGSYQMKFVLVHGAGHGAWCWYKVVDRLENAGCVAVAVDLRSAGVDPADPNQVRTLADYSAPLVELLQSIPQGEKVILVGHSMGGLSLTYVMELMPEKIAASVFVVANMYSGTAKDAELHSKLFEKEAFGPKHLDFFYAHQSDSPTSAVLKKDKDNRKMLLYHLCPAEDVTLANMLLKPSPLLPVREISVATTAKKYGSIPRFYIKALKDQLLTPEEQSMYVEINPPDRVLELQSDHSPFFSTPQELVKHLLEIFSSVSC